MKVLLTYGENSQDVLNYAELDGFKSRLDNQPVLDFKLTYLDNDNAESSNAYITVKMDDALKTTSLKDIKSYNTINIYDDIMQVYYIGTILRAVYVNNTTCRIEFYLLPIQTNYLNGVSRYFDTLVTRSPTKPTYSNNIAQDIVGETVTSVNYNSSVSAALKEIQSVPMIMLVINKDLTPLGIQNRAQNVRVPAFEIVLDNPLSACATKVAGTTVPGFVLYFRDESYLQTFINSCFNADIKVKSPIFGQDGKTYQAPKNTSGANWSGGAYTPIAKREDLIVDALSRGAAVMDAERVDTIYIPESINPSSFIMCREIPYDVTTSLEPIEYPINLPITINSEPYFNLSSLLQIKCVSSTGQSMVLDGNNILFNDGNPAEGFNCRIIVSLTGADLYIGESSYVMNLCKFPEASYTGNSYENYNTVNARSGVLGKLTNTATRFLGTAIDKIYNGINSGFQSTDGANSKSYENIALDKTSVIGGITAAAWTLATFHIETTYLPSGVKARLNAVYERFGYVDYSFKNFDINSIPKGFWQVSQIEEVNTANLTSITYINNELTEGIKSQLTGGVYVK